MNHEQGICPVCNGSGKRTLQEKELVYANCISSYDPATNTASCLNCIPKGMFASNVATGKVRLNKQGQPCTHEYESRKIGRCYYQYTCKHCGDSHSIDSGD